MPVPRRRRGHLGAEGSVPAAGERTEVLYEAAGAVVEHIVSSAAVEPVAYDQDHDEWVMVLEGAATLEVEGVTVELAAGDWLVLPARQPHTVTGTAAGTRWLAVHLPP
jgi:quercetin dioxygenase-like cupin family protein